MTFPVHRSDEATPAARGEAFGRAMATQVQHTVAVYERMFAERGVTPPGTLPPHEEIDAIARGAQVDPAFLRAVNARTEILNGADECSVQGAGGLLAQNWDWHPDLSASTVIWIVETPSTWFATVTEAGILAKIGLNDAGLGVCLNILRTTADGGTDGTPIHILLREVLTSTKTVDDAIALLTNARVTASSAITVATPGDVAHVELSPGGANVIRGAVGAHTNHFIEPPKAGTDVMALESPTTHQRLEIVKSEPLLDALRSHAGHPRGVCRHVDPQDPWVDRTVTVASVVMNLEKRRLHVAAGPPCSHEHVEIKLPTPSSSDRLASTAAR
ncbi:C45 family peptidase [Solirubrobacter phytolaccae]|uniref:C45 family peptidase n=1 Tax=Solirubrobacter phytolaccae TaxID=1404360 RepID=A0A9X3S7Q9_9ACTN|nr:C45 family peptidase [Solirubrobacter phytolaccae]MDA0181309.1 C45 family peptidase [Solirubrobacter phytolaccae]